MAAFCSSLRHVYNSLPLVDMHILSGWKFDGSQVGAEQSLSIEAVARAR